MEIDEFPAISGFCLMNPGWLKGVSTLDTQFQDGKALNALGLCWKPTWILFIKPAWWFVFSVHIKNWRTGLKNPAVQKASYMYMA